MTIYVALVLVMTVCFLVWIFAKRLNFPGEIGTVTLVGWIICLVILVVTFVFGNGSLHLLR